MELRVRLQLAEALSPVNRWFCSEFHRCKIDDPERLVEYYVRNGGADGFARRYCEAMSPENRWYCSMFFGQEVRDPQTLWDYYMHQISARAAS